jgi:hypothetical protein
MAPKRFGYAKHRADDQVFAMSRRTENRRRLSARFRWQAAQGGPSKKQGPQLRPLHPLD